MKGLDFRKEALQCRNLIELAVEKIADKRKSRHFANAAFGKIAKETESKSFEELENRVKNDLDANPPSPEEWESTLAQCAIEAEREGYVLLAIARDLTANEAEILMAQKYREHLRLCPPAKTKQRARVENWLPIISEFEDAQDQKGGARSQVFTRYRRSVDGIRFT